ncbi:MAG TPA: putative glycoside hydrolase [Candidatus Binatia bacterium]|nr:putative glycoside hydrolase [Candidatus Binatia bacterium]
MRAAAALWLVLAAVVPAAAERAIEVAGYLARFDPETVPVWPLRLQLLVGGDDLEGPLVGAARRRAEDAGNPARFFFYLSFSSLDSRCQCFESDVLARLRREHPEFLLRDAKGEIVSTFLDQLPPGRQLATDVGNPAYVDWWADVTLETAQRHGWDGVFADNVIRGELRDGSWSAVPLDPRARGAYETATYRADMLAALRRLRARYDEAGKLVIANHSAAWRTFEDDPVIRKQALVPHGVQLEDFAFTFAGAPHPEADWLRQLRYMDFLNRHGVLTWAGGESLQHVDRREYALASYLLTRRNRSVVGDMNAVVTWWPALAADLGDARGGFYCLDPAKGFARADPCPAPGRIVGRDFGRARVLVNPGDRAQQVPLGTPWRDLDGAPAPDPLPLGPHTGRVLLHDDHTASRTSSGRAER